MIFKSPSESKSFLFDYSNAIGDGEEIVSIHSYDLGPSCYADGVTSIGKRSVSISISGGEEGESYGIVVIVSTSNGNLIAITDLLVSTSFDSEMFFV